MRFIFILFAFASLTACSKPAPVTVEETVLMQAFVTYYGALAYDEVCNGTDPKSRYDFGQQQNVMLFGNQNMLAARVGGLWHVRYPERSVDDGVKHLLAIKNKIEAKTKEILKAEGCTSEKSKSFTVGYDFYSKNNPGVIFATLDKEIVKRGGKVTSIQEIEAVGKPVKETK